MHKIRSQQKEIAGAVQKFIWLQVSVVVLSALSMLIFVDLTAAASVLIGGAVGFLTSWIYAKKMTTSQECDIKQVVQAHYKAEAYKLIFTILLFSLIFTQFKGVRVMPLFFGYGSSLAVYWLALILL
jgi:ATP synthase protein I